MAKKSHSVHSFKVILVYLLAAGIGSLGTHLVLSTQQSKPTETSIPQPSQSATPPQEEAGDFKTYKNLPHGFTIQYPKAYAFMKNTDDYDVVFFRSAAEKEAYDACLATNGPCEEYLLALRFVSTTKPEDKRLEAFLKENKENPSAFSPTIIGGISGLQRQSPRLGVLNDIYVNRGEHVFMLSATAGSKPAESMEFYKELLSTLQFTN